MKSNRMTGCAVNAWFTRCLFLLISVTLLMALMPSAHAAELPEVCYPTSVQCSEDKTELKKIYDLTPEADPKGIARSDFERDGYHYTLVELLGRSCRRRRAASTRRPFRSRVPRKIWNLCSLSYRRKRNSSRTMASSGP